jgi:UDP-glucuronate decarboxylase
MSKALITGGIGFIGYHLSRRLLGDGYQVHALDNGSRGVLDADVEGLRADPRYELILSDVMDDAGLPGLDEDYTEIYHLAAIVGVSNVVGRPYQVLRNNVDLLAKIVQFARRQKKLQRLVFASTSEVYAGTLHYFGMQIPTPESTPLTLADLDQPRTSYMLSKIYGEALCRWSGLPFTIVRPHNLYGPRMGVAHVIPEIMQRGLRTPPGGSIVVFSPEHRRTFCYIDDAIELIIRLARSEAALNGTFNVGSTCGEISMASLAEVVLEIVGKAQTIERGPETEGSPPRRCPDMQRAIAATGYTPASPLDEGVPQTYAWYRRHHLDEPNRQRRPRPAGSAENQAAGSGTRIAAHEHSPD